MSEVYIPNNIDGLIIDLTELVAKVRADVIDECLSVVEWDGYTIDIKERIEALKEKKV